MVNSSITNYTEVYGSQVTMQCSITYETKFGSVHLSWLKFRRTDNITTRGSVVYPPYYGEDLDITSYNYSLAIPGKDAFIIEHHYLTISPLSFEDKGPYQCIASNQFAMDKSPYLDLIIIGGWY